MIRNYILILAERCSNIVKGSLYGIMDFSRSNTYFTLTNEIISEENHLEREVKKRKIKSSTKYFFP